MLIKTNRLTHINVVLRHYEPGDAYLHAQRLRDRYGHNVFFSYRIKNKVPEFKFSVTLQEKSACQVM